MNLTKHGTNDWDACGCGGVELKFGRKVKIRKELQAQGVIADSKSYDGTYSFNKPRVANDLSIQCATYNFNKSDAIVKEVERQLEGTGIEVLTNNWID